MSLLDDRADIVERGRDRHVCWVVADDAPYAELAEAILADGRAVGRKTVAFGPAGSAVLEALAHATDLTADPRVAFLGGGPLDPEAMFSMFREQTAIARSEGYVGLCLVADMDWLLAAHPTVDDMVGFELSLDRVVTELEATVVCAYRTSSFDAEAVEGVLSVHPVPVGAEAAFTLVAGEGDGWRLSGEVDVAGATAFASALAAATRTGPCVIDLADLDFIDIAGLRTIASAARRVDHGVALCRVPPIVRHVWQVTGLAGVAPGVELTD